MSEHFDPNNPDHSDDVTEAPESGEPRGEDELLKLRSERDSLFERLARTTAEFQNARKRLETEADQRLQYANGALLKSLLPVFDNLERAVAVDPAKVDGKSILKGVQVVVDQFVKVLAAQNVESIAPEPGTPFNPNLHEALLHQPSDYPENTVTQLLQKGYRLRDRTLRPAQVAVSK